MSKETKFMHFIGVDVSKNTLDLCVINSKGKSFYKFENSKKGLKSGIAKLKKECEIIFHEALFCIELTGNYSNKILYYLHGFQTNIWLEMPIQIKKSSGVNRLKTDKHDAEVIASYAKRFQDKFQPWEKPRKQLIQLKKLYLLREKIVKNISQYKSSLKEVEFVEDEEIMKYSKSTFNSIIKLLNSKKIDIEQKIKQLIAEDRSISNIYKIITSVPGIGEVTAVEMIICTNEFKSIQCPKKYACYAGVAPFEQSSGTALFKSRISHMANKTAKKSLHLGAMSAIVRDGELKDYYYRKLADGKPKMSALNAVRNKIIGRAFACVKRNELYKADYNSN